MSQLPLFKCVKAVATYAGPPMFLMGITLSDSTYISASGAVSTLARSLFHNTMPAHSLSKNKETKKREREKGGREVERGRERDNPNKGGGSKQGGGKQTLHRCSSCLLCGVCVPVVCLLFSFVATQKKERVTVK